MSADKNLIQFTRRIYHFIKNQTYDLVYLGVPLGITVKTKFSHIGSYDAGYSDYSVVKYVFSHLAINSDDVLVDVGCAKGRVIGWWLKNGYTNRIVGVELDKDLSSTAKKLFRNHKNVEIVTGDILQNMPQDGTIFYLFNPFKREIIKKFKQKIVSAFYNKKITIIYCNCEFIDEFYSDEFWDIEIIKFPATLTNHKVALIKPNLSKFELINNPAKIMVQTFSDY